MNSQEFLQKENQMLRQRMLALELEIVALNHIATAIDKCKDAEDLTTIALLMDRQTGKSCGEIDIEKGNTHVFVRNNTSEISGHIRYNTLLEAYQELSQTYTIKFIYE